ncbi:MAG: glutathione peroxidase [Flavobacteriales bacterium]|nr:glutathione peroxidase [Flavobacteriales bacterium]
MKLGFTIVFFIMSLFNFFSSAPITDGEKNFYAFEVADITNKTFDFEQLKGKKVMIVNTASKCGYTPQYKELQELYLRYKDHGFIIIAFPSNDFLYQEPGDNEKIEKFCSEKYQITFPLMYKVKVKGKNMHPVYQFLTNKSLNGVLDSKVKWNFQKYLIDEKGELAKMLKPSTNPLDSAIINWIEN